MELTYAQAHRMVVFLIQDILEPHYPDTDLAELHRDLLLDGLRFDADQGLTARESVLARVHHWGNLMSHRALDIAVPSLIDFVTWEAGFPFVNWLPTRELVELVYPDEPNAERETIIGAIELGVVTNTAFLLAYLTEGQHERAPSLTRLLHVAHDAQLGPVSLPEVPDLLGFLQPAHLNFLVGCYVVAFARAPEHEGLAYWASQLARMLESGEDELTARATLARDIYWAGTGHGEHGTGFDDVRYIELAYAQAMQRKPTAEESAYWIELLQREPYGRSSLLSHLLDQALDGEHPPSLFHARLEAGKFAAWFTQGQRSAPVDLRELITSMDDPFDVAGAIVKLGPDAIAALAPQRPPLDPDDYDIPPPLYGQYEMTDRALFEVGPDVAHAAITLPATPGGSAEAPPYTEHLDPATNDFWLF